MYHLEYSLLQNPIGLHNTGTVCYLNSLLQVLVSCTSLHYVEWSNNSLEQFLKNIIMSGLKTDSSVRLLSLLRTKLHNSNYANSFGNGQESASEALTLLLNTIDNPSLTNMFIHRFRYKLVCDNCHYLSDEIKDHCILFDLFHANEISVENMAIQNTKLDSKCKCGSFLTKRSVLTMLPEIICCIFNIYYTKSKHEFPLQLEFPSNNTTLKYRVVGQIEHSGSLHGGHYWSRALRKKDIFLFNDMSYNTSKFEPNDSTYMVFYHLVKN
jgi:ubiquitin C-terminal hydrolase